MKQLLTILLCLTIMHSASAKTLIVYYSYTNNIRTVVQNLQNQIEADVLEVLPAEEGVKYEANNYAIGSALISAIRSAPNDASSYPAIKTTISNLADYSTIIIATPLWWSNMAAPMQTFLFNYGSQMAGKNVGLIVSSASSGISGVESDAKRLVPGADWFSKSLHVTSSNTSRSANLLTTWLTDINYSTVTVIKDVSAARADISSITYYSADGRKTSSESKGLKILRTQMADGKVFTRKLLK